MNDNTSFTYLDELIHSGQKEIILDDDVILEENEEDLYYWGICVDVDDIIIDGNGHTVNARSLTRIFKINAKNFTIKNLTLTNGLSDFGSAAFVYGESNGIFENCCFRENASGYGGAIYNENAVVTVINCNINNNYAERGAAITNYFGNLEVKDTSFHKNSAEKYGGAINNAFGKVILIKCEFQKNHAKLDGGSITNYTGRMIIEDSIFTKNEAESNGGAIHNIGDVGLLFFTDKEPSEDNALYEIEDLNSRESYLSINDSTFKYNRAVSGGALCNSTLSILYIDNSSFTINLADEEYSADIHNDSKLIFLKESFFNNHFKSIVNTFNVYLVDDTVKNRIHNKGHIIYKLKENEKNFAHLNALMDAKDITLDSDIVLDLCDIEESKFSSGFLIDENNITIDGKGYGIANQLNNIIFRIRGKNIHLKNLVLRGKIQIDNDATCIIEKSRFEKASIINNGSVTVKSCKFSNNNVSSISNEGMLTVKQSVFEDNTAEKGCAIYVNDPHAVTYIIGCDFIKNRASKIGGAIYTRSLSLVIRDCKFNHNVADKCGGAIYIECDPSYCSITIAENFVKEETDYDKIHAEDMEKCTSETLIEISNSSFKINKALRGGAILNDSGVLLLNDVLFDGNMAQNSGGAIYNHFGNLSKWNRYADCINRLSRGLVLINNTEFNDNSSEDEFGDDIYNETDIILKKLVFSTSQKSIINRGECCLATRNNEIIEKIHNNSSLIDLHDETKISFKHFNEMLASKSISLNRDIKHGARCLDYDKILIDGDNIMIDGLNHIIDTGYNEMIISGNNILIKNVTIKGDIHIEKNASCIFDNVNILNSEVTNQSDMTIKNSKITESERIKNEGELTIIDSEISYFRNIYYTLLNFKNLKLKKVVIKGNNPEILIENNDIMSVEECEITDNHLKRSAIINRGKSADIRDTVFDNPEIQYEIINESRMKLKNLKIEKPENRKYINNKGKLELIDSELKSNVNNHGKVICELDSEEISDVSKLIDMISKKETRIVLEDDIFFQDNDWKLLEGGIRLDYDNLTIDGKNHFIDFNNVSGIFRIIAKNIRIKNIQFRNGYVSENLNYDFDEFKASIMIDSYAEVTFKNCTFKDNESEEDAGVVLNKGILYINDCYFLNNQSKKWGGAILNKGFVSIYKSIFRDNRAREGGAIYNIGNQSFVEIFDSKFINNHAIGRGGAVQNNGIMSMQKCNFSRNNTGALKGSGGAVSNENKLIISTSSFYNNQAKMHGRGGSIANRESGKLIIKNSILESCNAYNGGAIICYKKSENNVKKCVFRENSAQIYGGAIDNWGGKLNVEDSLFEDNLSRGYIYEKTIYTDRNGYTSIKSSKIVYSYFGSSYEYD